MKCFSRRPIEKCYWFWWFDPKNWGHVVTFNSHSRISCLCKRRGNKLYIVFNVVHIYWVWAYLLKLQECNLVVQMWQVTMTLFMMWTKKLKKSLTKRGLKIMSKKLRWLEKKFKRGYHIYIRKKCCLFVCDICSYLSCYL